MVTIPLKKAPQLWKKRMRKLQQVQRKTPREASKLMQRIAKRLAPRKTGETIRGIIRRQIKNGWSVQSWVGGQFKQNLFANRTAPFRTIRYTQKNPFFAVPQTVVYGRSAKSPSGNPIRWTGKPRFWHFASLRTRKHYKKQARKNTRKALRTRF